MAKIDSFNIIPRQKLDIPKWVNPTIGFCVVLICIMIGFFIYFSLQASFWGGKAKAKEAEYASLNTEENKSVEKRVGQISKQLEKFSEIFASKKTSFVVFDFLRSFCHPNVSFSSLALNLKTGELALAGKTDTYQSLSEQVIIFKELKNIENLNVSDIFLNKEGQVTFRISFILSQTFFQNK